MLSWLTVRLFVVLNPAAGRASGGECADLIRHAFKEPAWQTTIYETTGKEAIAELVQAAIDRGAELIVAAGGDGTVSAVVDGLANSELPLGIIPSGTTNVLAQELGIPLNIEKACRVLAAGEMIPRAIDAIQVGERYFVIGVGAGADAEVMKNTGRSDKKRFGSMAYVWSAFKTIAGLQPRRFTIIIDGKAIQLNAALVLLSNVGTLTRPLRWGPHIHPDDGRIDINVIRGRHIFDYTLAAFDVLPGRRHRPWHIRHLTAYESVQIISEQPTLIQGDGELLGETPLEAAVVSGAVKIMVPAKRAA